MTEHVLKPQSSRFNEAMFQPATEPQSNQLNYQHNQLFDINYCTKIYRTFYSGTRQKRHQDYNVFSEEQATIKGDTGSFEVFWTCGETRTGNDMMRGRMSRKRRRGRPSENKVARHTKTIKGPTINIMRWDTRERTTWRNVTVDVAMGCT